MEQPTRFGENCLLFPKDVAAFRIERFKTATQPSTPILALYPLTRIPWERGYYCVPMDSTVSSRSPKGPLV